MLEISPKFNVDPVSLALDADAAKELGASLHDAYASAEPYPHICLDNAFPPVLLERVLAEVSKDHEADRKFSGNHEKNKSQTIPERFSPYPRDVFYMLNSRGFLQFLENLTGIDGLIPDPYFLGGGLHEVGNGGFLNIHADFNLHKKFKVERRLNVLIYLNKDWKQEYGGSFEIWDTGMTKQFRKIEPLFNRMVVFTTASDTMHGNPDPVAHPDGAPRRSLALYYYTATWGEGRKEHSTIFKGRAGTADKSGLSDRIDRIVDDVLPPIVNRQVKRIRRKLGL